MSFCEVSTRRGRLASVHRHARDPASGVDAESATALCMRIDDLLAQNSEDVCGDRAENRPLQRPASGSVELYPPAADKPRDMTLWAVAKVRAWQPTDGHIGTAGQAVRCTQQLVVSDALTAG